MAKRSDKNFGRTLRRALGKMPLLGSQLEPATGYPRAFVEKRLAEWCSQGRVVAGVIAQDSNGRPVVLYRLSASNNVREMA